MLNPCLRQVQRKNNLHLSPTLPHLLRQAGSICKRMDPGLASVALRGHLSAFGKE